MSHKTRGRPFTAGNPGRPRGAKNKTTIMFEQLGEGQAEQLIEKTIELALGGNVRCLGMLLDRIWPARKSAPIALSFPPIKSPQDVLAAVAALLTAVGDGRLSNRRSVGTVPRRTAVDESHRAAGRVEAARGSREGEGAQRCKKQSSVD